MMEKNVISVIDGEAGSCGKAKVVGELATDQTLNIGASVTNCMPNAGHTFVDEVGNQTVFRNIPVSIVNPNTALFIGPGSAIDMDIFIHEYENVKHLLNGRKIYVHELVPIIESRHKEWEKEHIKSGSTFKGCGAVTTEKVVRDPELKFFKGYKDAIVLKNDDWLELLYQHLDNPDEYVLLEGAQGCDLSLNHSSHYPNTTSRNVSTAQLLSDSGIAADRLLETIMVIRPFPIRISNITEQGEFIYSGDCGKGDPLTWTQINLASMTGGYPFTGDVDSIYDSHIDKEYIKRLLRQCSPLFLKQIWGENYQKIDVDQISLLDALELERLVNKSKKENPYETKLIDIPMFTQDYPENTIFDQSEQTSVTKKERRIFDIDIKRLRNNCRINNPYVLYLNFFQHLDLEMLGMRTTMDIRDFEKPIRNHLQWIENETNTSIACLGTGPRNNERIKIKELIKRR